MPDAEHISLLQENVFKDSLRLITIILIVLAYIHMILTHDYASLQLNRHFYTLSWPKCPLCNFKPLKYWSNSTPDDFFIMYAYGTPNEIYPCIRSIRTVGSRCQIVLIIDAFDVSPMFQEPFYADCGVTLVYYHNATKRFPCMIGIMHHRWPAFADYLRDLGGANRVCISDTDVLMQEDPFSTYINQRTENDLYLMDQAFTFTSFHGDRDWANGWYMPERGDFPLRMYLAKPTVNCGSIFGSYRAMYLLCQEMADRFISAIDTHRPCSANDQGSFYNIIYSNWLVKNNITHYYFNSYKHPYIFIINPLLHGYPNCSYNENRAFYVHHLQTSNQLSSIRPMCPKISQYDRLRFEYSSE